MSRVTVLGSLSVRVVTDEVDATVDVDLQTQAIVVRDYERLLVDPQQKYRVRNALTRMLNTVDDTLEGLGKQSSRST